MANKIIIKKSSVAAKVPLASDLEIGEISVNLADQKLYSKNASGTVILVGSSATGTVTSVSGTGTVSGLTLTGTVTSSGSLTLGGTLSAVTSLNSLTGGLSIVAGNNTTVTASGANITIGDSGYTIVNITATTYTFVLSDVQKLIIFNPSANGTYTIPPVSSVNFPVGSAIDVIRYSGPTVTFAAGSGVTLNGPNSKTLRTTYSGATLIHTSTDVWVLVGDAI